MTTRSAPTTAPTADSPAATVIATTKRFIVAWEDELKGGRLRGLVAVAAGSFAPACQPRDCIDGALRFRVCFRAGFTAAADVLGSTGEVWDDVAIRFSTARPARDATPRDSRT